MRRVIGLHELLDTPSDGSTRAIWIDAPASAVWPWLAQIGPAPRGGFYSHDWSRKVRDAWAAALAEAELSLATDETMIDKIAISPALAATDPLIFPPEKMSDHHAVSCLLQRRLA